MSGVRVVDVRVHGRVQGVGFRWFVMRSARALGVSGWVRNSEHGDVEVRAMGDASRVDALLEALRRGPAHASVQSIEVDERSAGEAGAQPDFEIIP